jgi:hypothetical protein
MELRLHYLELADQWAELLRVNSNRAVVDLTRPEDDDE